MTAQTRAAVWLDHQQARVFHVDLEGFDEERLRAPQHHVHRHAKGHSEGHARLSQSQDEKPFFEAIVKALAAAEEILLLGPSTARAQFLRYVETHAHALSTKIAGVEASDHPTDAQIVEHVRNHFRIPAPRVR